ncbi:NAD-dependent epimerase/dehydratase family protein [Algicella marina]|uniref:NAD-dependent epimerase/dehydratase family protein n=1 Tax=Algicella marina TaxID=2683284 RepID=A0A6P1SWD3_9RHOB|nr:NAD-dependent epimerase/dehydratase family protein [Algicella marina]QHQ34077.1 NAD-dependent epimerase/dehydratase family protein [Algicella marina]
MTNTLRAGLVGAGYIATWHANTIKALPGVELTAVCDTSPAAAEALAGAYGAKPFTSLDDLIAAGICDAVHIVTPPQVHKDLAIQAMEGGLHAFVEKPVALGAEETAAMQAASEATGKIFAAGHNFLGTPKYEKLKGMVTSGELGRIASAEINWRFPLAPLRSGPYTIWMLREPKNLLLELGPHLYAFCVDLFGVPSDFTLRLSKPVALPGDDIRHQVWRIMCTAGGVDVTFHLSLVEALDDRSVTVRGSAGMALLDYANDTLVVTRENASDLILNPFRRAAGQGMQNLKEAFGNAFLQTRTLNQKSPYGLSFLGTIGPFYEAIRDDKPIDSRFSGASAVKVMTAIDETVALLPGYVPVAKPATRKPEPKVMVIGGTGFIGRHLTRTLVERGHDVRVLSRGRNGPFPDLADHVETVGVSLKDRAGLAKAMEGIDVVYNLAKSMDDTWEAALENDVGVAVGIAEAALEAGVKRLIYTGTIASYNMASPEGTITEDVSFGDDLTDRNMYARSKAECERRLMEMHREKGLPLVIARPGIVIGPGGPLQHWGIGRWHGAGAVRIWGHGRNILPFVLIEDVSDGLIRMMDNEDAVGRSFNLVGEPMMSARGYFDAIHEALGAKIDVRPGNLHMFHAAASVKHFLKTKVLGRKGLSRASLKDWQSRAHFTPFDNRQPKEILGWEPETDRQTFIQKGIIDANLMGF